MANEILSKIFRRFPMLKPEIMEIIVSVLTECRTYTLEMVGSIIEAEQNYIFTNDMDFKENKTDGPNEEPLHPSHPDYQAQQQRLNKPQPQMSRQNTFIKEIRSRIDMYFNLVLRSVRDTVPKQVGFFLVQRA